MEKKFFNKNGSKEERALHEAVVSKTQKHLSAWYGFVYMGKGKDLDGETGNSMFIEIPDILYHYDDILKAAGVHDISDLSALADEVATTICDANTKEAFKKFANLLIEKVEKK